MRPTGGDVVGVWKSTVPALNARAARDFVRHHVGGHDCSFHVSEFRSLSLRNDKYNFAEKGTPRWRKYQGQGQRNVTRVQKGARCGRLRWLCLDGAERHADDFPYATSHSLDWTVFEKFQLHFVEPRHALNGGGPMAMEEFMAQDTLLRRHHHTHLRSSRDISCIAASLMRSRVPFELSVYSNATESRSAHSEVAQAMRVAEIVVRIPGATYVSISGPVHADMLAAHAAQQSVLPYHEGRSSLPSIVERSGRYGEAACEHRTRRYSLRHITILSSKPDRTMTTLRNVWGDSPLLMVPPAPLKHEASRLRALEKYLLLLSRDFSVRSYWNWHPFMDFHPGACACHADPRVRAGARHCDGHCFWLAPFTARVARRSHTPRLPSHAQEHGPPRRPMVRCGPGQDARVRGSHVAGHHHCATPLTICTRVQVRRSQDPYSGATFEALCTDFPLPHRTRGDEPMWADRDVEWLPCLEARNSTIDANADPERWAAMGELRDVVLAK